MLPWNRNKYYVFLCRSQCTRGPRRRFAGARPLRSWVRIPPGEWMFVCCECCVLSGRGLCDELITRPEESYRLWCVVVCGLETSRIRRPWPALGRSAPEKNITYSYSFGYPACNAHSPCCLWPLWLYHIFPTSFPKRHDFWENIIDHKICIYVFCTAFAGNISPSKKSI